MKINHDFSHINSKFEWRIQNEALLPDVISKFVLISAIFSLALLLLATCAKVNESFGLLFEISQ